MLRLFLVPILAFAKVHFSNFLLGSLWIRPNGPSTGAANSAAQPALNVQAQGNAVLPLSQAVITTAETAILNPAQSSTFLQVQLPPNLADSEQTPLDLVFSGFIKTTASGTVTLTVREGSSATLGSNTQIAHSSGVTQNSASAPFKIHVNFTFDSTSGKMVGEYDGYINNVLITRTALDAVVTGLSNSSDPVLTFILSVTSSGAGSGTPTTVYLQRANVG